MPHGLLCVVGLMLSNIFMTFAWYGHLRAMSHRTWLFAALVSWGIALFEYLIQVPANRTGHQVFSVAQLKILQEVITLVVFVPFAVLYLRERLSLNYLFAGMCMVAAVFFIFRDPVRTAEATPAHTAGAIQAADQ